MPKSKNIYKRKDGRWEGRYLSGKKADGTTRYKSIYRKTYGEVKQALSEIEKDICPELKASKILFSTILKAWMQTNSINQKGSTKLKYDYLIDNHIIPELGGYEVHKLTDTLINDFLLKKLSDGRLDKKTGGLSNSYVKTMAIIIKSSLEFAYKKGFCKEISDSIVKPSVEVKEITVLSVKEQSNLENHLKLDNSLEALGIMIALNTGLRIGEICALSWEDINFESQVIHVRHTITRTKNTYQVNKPKTLLVIDKPKTKASCRDIPITSKMLPILKSAAETSKSKFVISTGESFVSPRTFEYRYHKKLNDYNIPQVNFHALRHTFATRCIEKGVDVKTLSEILGHSNASITLNTYVHSSMDLKRQQLEKLD